MSNSTAPRRPVSRMTKVILALSIVVPVGCALISGLAGAPGPHIPFFDPTGPVYLDLFTALAAASALLLVIPGAIAAYKWFGIRAAILLVLILAALFILCVNHVTWS